MRDQNKINSMVQQIPGYNSNSKSKSYLLRIAGIKGIKIGKNMKVFDDHNLEAELHMTFLYRDMKADK